MKKAIFCFVCFVCSSCSILTTTTTLIGDVTTYTQTGEVLQKWEQVVLQQDVNGYTNSNAFKTFGINFYDKKSGKHIIIGNAVPYIIEYTTNITNIGSTQSVNAGTTNSGNGQTGSEQTRSEDVKNKLISQWRDLSAQEQTLKAEMKKMDKASEEYQSLKNKHKGIIIQMESVANKLWTLFGYDIYMRGL